MHVHIHRDTDTVMCSFILVSSEIQTFTLPIHIDVTQHNLNQNFQKSQNQRQQQTNQGSFKANLEPQRALSCTEPPPSKALGYDKRQLQRLRGVEPWITVGVVT